MYFKANALHHLIIQYSKILRCLNDEQEFKIRPWTPKRISKSTVELCIKMKVVEVLYLSGAEKVKIIVEIF